MKKTILALSAFAIILASCDNKAPDSVKTAEQMNENKQEAKIEAAKANNDADFAVKVAEGNMMEVQLGELAQVNATSSKVKEFGKTLIKDHGVANEELKELAMKKQIVLPAKLGDAKMKDYNDLNAKKGNEFDRAFADYMVKDHEEDIKSFKDEAANGKDADMRAWADGKIATLEHHLMMANEVKAFVKK